MITAVRWSFAAITKRRFDSCAEKALHAQRGLDLAQRIAQGWRHGGSSPGGNHALARAHEELVAHQLAQPPQCVAHRGLGQVQPLARDDQVALFVDRIEDLEKVEVHAAKAHLALSRQIERHAL